MKTKSCVPWTVLLVLFSITVSFGFEKDTIATAEGDIILTFIGHSTLMMEHKGLVIHVDPWSRLADYTLLPKADIILITHHHGDHLDTEAIGTIEKNGTEIILTELCRKQTGKGTVMKNGDTLHVAGITIEAVPAYNIQHLRENGQPYHPKGEGNGYVLTLGKSRIYMAGDTENVPEMKALQKIDVAFLPMNLPYTMSPEMVADAAKAFRPAILYPYHFGNTDTNRIVVLLKDEQDITLRIRNMK